MSGSISNILGSAQVKSIVANAENKLAAPITVETNQVKADKAQITALGSVKGSLSSLSSALSGISDPASINSMVATPSNSTVAATAKSSAASGSYSLTSIKLAKPQEVYSPLFTSSSAAVGSGAGTLAFKFASGGSATVNIGSSQDTVSGIAAAINQSTAGVKASIVQTSSGARLVLTSSKTGSGQAFTFTGTGSVASLAYPGSGSTTGFVKSESAQNASFNINGIPVTETTNSASGVVKGVNVTLSASGSSNLVVKNSPASLSSALSGFADKLNGAIGEIAKLTAYKPPSASASASASAKSKGSAGPLLGNVQVEQLSQSLLSSVSSAAASGLTANTIGLTVGSGGKITFSSATFAAAYQAHPNSVAKLVQTIEGSVQGVVAGAIGYTPPSTSTTGSAATTNLSSSASTGFLQSAITDLQTTVTSIDTQIKQQQQEGSSQIAILEKQLQNAEATISNSSTTLAYLGATLGTSKSGSGG